MIAIDELRKRIVEKDGALSQWRNTYARMREELDDSKKTIDKLQADILELTSAIQILEGSKNK